MKRHKITKKILSVMISLALGSHAMTSMILPAQAATYTVTDETSLNNALSQATAGDTIQVSNGFVLSGVKIPAGSGFILTGNDKQLLGNNTFAILDMTGEELNSLQHIELNNGNSATTGGALTVDDVINGIDDVAFRNNTSTSDGGAVYIADDLNGGLTDNIHIDTNQTTSGNGGGIYVGHDFNGGIQGLTSDSHFDGNKALAGNGGGLYVGNDFNGRIYANYFAGNQAINGGGMYVGHNFTGTLDSYSFFINNIASGDGGGLYVANDFIGDIKGAIVNNNTSQNNGGGFYINNNLQGNLGGDYTGNTASADGGAVWIGAIISGNIQGTFNTNTATNGSGGAIWVSSNLGGGILNSVFKQNTAGTNGGAVDIEGSVNGDLNNIQFIQNKTTNGQGGALNIGGDITGNINQGVFHNNQSKLDGGAIDVAGSINGTITSDFTANSSDSGNGGAINAGGNLSNITNSNFLQNIAGTDGGAINTVGNIDGDINKTTFYGNKANNGSGGAISTTGTINNILNTSEFSINSASGDGGAINTSGIIGNIDKGVFFLNTSDTGNGGAINTTDGITGALSNTTFLLNEATSGSGGAINTTGSLSDILNSKFSLNTAGANGGAIAASSISGDISGSNFLSNRAGGLGGALYIDDVLNISVTSGKTSEFSNNRDSTGLNSIHFASTATQADFNVDGTLYLYDPISADSVIDINKTGSGLLVLGGKNMMNGGDWNIQSGTLQLTFDDDNGTSKINNIDNFNLSSDAILAVVPTEAPAEIDANGVIQLDGKVTLASDLSSIARPIHLNNNSIMLHLNQAYSGAGEILSTSGKFSLGFYDYEYENLGWINDNHDLSFVTTSETVNPGRSGSYAADSSYRLAMANETPNKIFEHIDSLLGDITTTDNNLNRELWGTFFNNTTRTDSHGIFAGSSAKVPGLVIGHDWLFSRNSFGGVAISYTWPQYKQESLQSDGKDVRLNLYGGTLLHNDWYLGYLATAGFGDLRHTRSIAGSSHSAKYDTEHYSVGFSLAKAYHPWKDNIIKPFMTYEYIIVKTDGYTESNNANDTGITSASHHENVSRLKAGSQWIYEFNADSNLKWSLYYQGLYGDRSANVHSSLNIDDNYSVAVPTEDIARHYLGTQLAWNMQLTPTSQFTLAYTGVFGERSRSNDFGINFEYKF